MKVQNNSIQRQHGGIMLVAVVMGGVMAVGVAAALSLSSYHNQSTVRSSIWNHAMVVAEAGVEEALAQLNSGTGTWTGNGWTLAGGQYSKRRDIGNDWYFVTVTTDPAVPTIVSTASMLLPAKSNRLARAVRVMAARRYSGFSGMKAVGKVHVGGTSMTDSYDSSNPAYSTRGLYDPAKKRDNGHIGTSSTVAADFQADAASTINGKISTGAAGVLAVANNASAGSFAWTAASVNNGIVQPGWHSTGEIVSYTNVIFPTASGAFTPSSASVGGTNYSYVLGNDKYWTSDLTLNSSMVLFVTGNATLIVNNLLKITSSGEIRIAPGASLTLYIGNQADISGRGIVNGTGSPANFICYGGPSTTLISYSGQSSVSGVFYAPNTPMTMTGGNDFYGASVSKSLALSGGFRYHYDEALGKAKVTYVVTSWNEI